MVCALRGLPAFLLLVAGTSEAGAADSVSRIGMTEYPSGQVAVTEGYYRQFNFDWTDARGVTHRANLLDRATEVEHMVALLEYVYTNPEIPGFVHDRAYDKMVADNAVDDALNEPDRYGRFRKDWADVPYVPCPLPPYNMTRTVVEKPFNGATALLVELKDSFEKPAGEEIIKDCVAAVSVIPKQIYVSASVDHAGNPGYLFNVESRLNKFFIVTKGRNRATFTINPDGTVSDIQSLGTRPFYHMYEEFSPSNEAPIYNIYAEMNAEKQFHVDHNCSSVIRQAHHIGLDQFRENPADYEHFPINLMFFLPDYRFLGDSRQNSPANSWQHYTYYPSSYMGQEFEARRPFFFFNKIKASIGSPEVDVTNHTVKVPVEWRSEYKVITDSKVPERFFIYRVKNGIVEQEPIPASQLEMRQEDTELEENTGAMVRENSEVVRIYVYESQLTDSYNVEYIVRGRREGSEFSFVESNKVQELIPGYSRFETIKININGVAASRFQVSREENDYSNTIDLLNNTSSEDYIKHGHIKAPAGGESGTRFTLRRYTGNDTGNYEEVAYLDITGVSLTDGYNVFDYKISYPDSRAYTGGLTSQFRTLRKANAEEQLMEPVSAMPENNGILARFIDVFSAVVADNQQAPLYRYHIAYESEISLTDTRAANRTAVSNIVDVNVPVRELTAGYEPYSLEDIKADSNCGMLLPENRRAIFFEARNNINIKSYEVLHIPSGSNEGTLIGKAERNPSGAYLRYVYPDAAEPRGKDIDGEVALTPTENAFQGVLLLPMVSGVTSEDQLVLVIRYQNGNTYGHRRIPVLSLPEVRINNYYIKHTQQGNTHEYLAGIGWNPVAESLEIDNETSWRPVAFRVWWDHSGNTGGMTGILDTTDGISEGKSSRVAADYPDDESGEAGTVSEVAGRFSLGYAPASERPVIVAKKVRMYSRIPVKYIASEDNITDGYVVGDADIFMKITRPDQDNPVLGVDSPETDADIDAPAVYYDLTGRRVCDISEPGIYLEVRGERTRKILVR